MRNNNPGNLEYGAFARSLGATGSDGRFAKFPTFEAGVQAQERLLAGPTYVGGGVNTIDKIVNRYAPPGDNNPVNNYADYVSRVTGIPRGQPIGPEQVPAVAAAMRQFENGGTGGGKPAKPAAAAQPVNSATQKTIDSAVDMVLEANGFAKDTATKQYRGGQAAQTARSYLREKAAALYATAGSAPAAARMAWDQMQRDARTTRERRAAQGGGSGWGRATVVNSTPPATGPYEDFSRRVAPRQGEELLGGDPTTNSWGKPHRVPEGTYGRNLSPAEARRLPAGTLFLGTDGVERVTNGGSVKVRTTEDAKILAPGTRYVRPDGVEMVR